MVPRTHQATEGRVNPKGIPCLYMSTDRDTAMSETRPWIGSYVSVAVFVVTRELKLVDCTVDPPKGVWVSWRLDGTSEPIPEPSVREQYAWGNINRAFSEPASRSDDVAEYAPTQYLAEAFRHAGYDGIVYGSKLGRGKTVAVFEIAAAKLINCQLHSVENIEFKFDIAGNPYYVQRQEAKPEIVS